MEEWQRIDSHADLQLKETSVLREKQEEE